MQRSLAIVLALVAASLGLAACGDDKESPQEARQHLCSSLDDFAASVVGLQGLGLSSSEDELNHAVDNVDNAWHQVVEDAKDAKTANTDNIRSAYDDLKQALEDRPKDQPLTEVVAGLQSKLAAFAQAWADLARNLDCRNTS